MHLSARIRQYMLTILLALCVLAASTGQPAMAQERQEEDVTPAAGQVSTQSESNLYLGSFFGPAHTAAGQVSTPPKSIFGVQAYGGTEKGGKYHDRLLETGAAWMRVPFGWSSVEPTNRAPRNFRWGRVDDPAGIAFVNKEIKVMLTVELVPDWAGPNPDGPINEANLKDFAEFMAAVVERYDGDGFNDAPGSPVIEYFELFNEPDGYCNGNRRWGHAGDRYAAMLKAVYGPMKQANPNAKVVFGGIAHDWFQTVDGNGVCSPVVGYPLSNEGGPFAYNFLDDVLKAGGGQYFDVMNFHTYPSFAKNWTMHCLNGEAACQNSLDASLFPFNSQNQLSVGIYEKTLFIRNKLAHYGLDKPIVITEAGISSNVTGFEDSGDTPQALQSEHVVAYFVQGLAADVKAVMWWTLYDVLPYNMGLVNVDNEPKDALRVYKTAVDQLGNAQFEEVLNTGFPLRVSPSWLGYGDKPADHSADAVTMEAYRFYDALKDHILYVAWLNPLRGEPPARPLQISGHFPGSQATVRDMYGQVKATISDGDDGAVDGRFTIQVSGEPLYIEVAESRLYLPKVDRP